MSVALRYRTDTLGESKITISSIINIFNSIQFKIVSFQHHTYIVDNDMITILEADEINQMI